MDQDLERRERRHLRRWGSRIAMGALAGVGLGVIGGLIWGAIAFRPGAPAMWAVAMSSAIFLGVVGAFMGGMSGLELPDPDMEPSQFDAPTHQPDGLTRREQAGGELAPPR